MQILKKKHSIDTDIAGERDFTTREFKMRFGRISHIAIALCQLFPYIL